MWQTLLRYLLLTATRIVYISHLLSLCLLFQPLLLCYYCRSFGILFKRNCVEKLYITNRSKTSHAIAVGLLLRSEPRVATLTVFNSTSFPVYCNINLWMWSFDIKNIVFHVYSYRRSTNYNFNFCVSYWFTGVSLERSHLVIVGHCLRIERRGRNWTYPWQIHLAEPIKMTSLFYVPHNQHVLSSLVLSLF